MPHSPLDWPPSPEFTVSEKILCSVALLCLVAGAAFTVTALVCL